MSEEEIEEEKANIYSKEYREQMEEDDELNPEEAAFMNGYTDEEKEEEEVV